MASRKLVDTANTRTAARTGVVRSNQFLEAVEYSGNKAIRPVDLDVGERSTGSRGKGSELGRLPDSPCEPDNNRRVSGPLYRHGLGCEGNGHGGRDLDSPGVGGRRHAR